MFVSIVVRKVVEKDEAPTGKKSEALAPRVRMRVNRWRRERESNVQHQRRSRWESHVVALQIEHASHALLHLRSRRNK